MKLEYHDKKADTLYIRFNDTPYAYSDELDKFRFLDYDSNGNVIGVELLNVSNGVNLIDLPNPKGITQILDSNQIRTLVG